LAQAPLPRDGVYVLELSSYQIDLTFSLDCDVAVLLNITPDHLDRYDGFEAYAASKARLFQMQSAGHLAIKGEVADFDQSNYPALQGPHNAQNIRAASRVALALGISDAEIERGLRSFPGLPHRCERVRKVNGVSYINDSKATNPESVAPALAAYPAIHWILGGQAKTENLDACAPHFSHVKAAYTIGEAMPLFTRLLRPHMPVTPSGTLERAVHDARQAAATGDTVLLSPACASFDQFRDFEARGDAFKQFVEALA
ncbi:MAG: UDP-N-acetylmuramoyl-L-alanine--D-glutamate ligase, partial [Alphaproteobacteria bacterium]|nr:UDP-N-acetylmuramoyl-L-alanine--D-glutamate ligase [Alphaproteobacteria bacterium]